MMAPLGHGNFARRGPSNRGDHRRGLDHPPANHLNLVFPPEIPKCEPALCPHPHVFTGKDERGLEIASEVLERTVTPEAHSYFLRIVKVTQSELEKLLVYKIQHLLAAPVAPSLLGATALEELGTAVTARLQMPGASTAAHIAEIEGRKSCGSLRHRSTQEKAVEEGRELTKYLISMMGRILADFGRLADTVLRWQLEKGAMYSGGLNVNDCRDGDTFQLTEPENIPKTSNDFKDFLERLERQDRQNSELEAKYNKVVDEQHTDRRAFMRERQLWREQLRQLKARLKRSKDPSLASLLDHDVQFFDGGEDRGEEEDIEDLRQRYEDRIARMQEDYEERIAELESLLEKLRLKLQALEERAARKSSEVRSASKESKSEAGADMEELMRLRQELEASKAENESLREELGRLQAQLQEAQEERSRLQDALSKYYADLESQPQRVHASTQASAPETRPVRRLKTEILQSLSIDIAPIELPPLIDEEALEEARAKILELERLLKEAEAREAAILAERDKLRKDLQDKMTQCELLEKELAEQKRLLDKASQASVAKRVAAAQTDPWQPDRLPPDDKALREKDELLEELRRQIKELEAICQDRQRTIDELRKQLAAALERIRKLEASQVVPPEEDSPPPPPVPRGSRRGSKGGGWTLVRRKDLGSILPEQDERRYWLPTSWPSPASRVFEGKKRGGMPLEYYKEEPLDDDFLEKACRCGSFFLEDSLFCRKCGVRRPGVRADIADAAERRAIPAVNMPVSGYLSPQFQHPPGGGGVDGQDFRHAYGGGFTVLDSTAWKGVDRQDLQPGSEAAKALLQPSVHETGLEEGVNVALKTNAVAASHTQSAPDLRTRSTPNETRPRSGTSASSRPKSAVSTSSSQAARHHPAYLHGPLERKGRPHSAVSLQGRSPSTQKEPSERNGDRRRPSSSLPRVQSSK